MVQRLDFAVLYALQKLHDPVLDKVMAFITHLGDGGYVWIAAGVLLLLCSKKYRKQGAAVLIGLLLGTLVGNGIVKNLVARPRPCWLDPTVALLVKAPKSFSFPSGHTLSSVIAAAVLWRTDRRIGWPAVILAALIGLSRLYLFVHFPTDVLGAAVLGIPLALAAQFVVEQSAELWQKRGGFKKK